MSSCDTPAEIREDPDHERLVRSLEKTAKQLTGTRREQHIDSRSLCTSCRWAAITRQASKNERRIRCGFLSMFVPDDIRECNEHIAVNELTLDQMARLAVLLDVRDHLKEGYR